MQYIMRRRWPTTSINVPQVHEPARVLEYFELIPNTIQVISVKRKERFGKYIMHEGEWTK